MDVILLERIEKLGQMGDVVTVKPGFARNYLLPKKKALRATKDNLAQFETQRAQLEADNLERRQDAEKVGVKLDGTTVILIRQASEAGQLYGSVTVRDVADAVTEAGFTIDRHQVALDRPIKTLGLHPIRVRLHPEVSVTVTASVAPTQDEAEALLRAAEAPAEAEEAPEAAAELGVTEAAPVTEEPTEPAQEDETD